MWPVLISLGPIKIYSLAVAFFVAVIAFFFVVFKKGRETHFDENELFDATILVFITALIGGKFGSGGLWPTLGLISGIIMAVYQAKKRRWDIFAYLDVVAIAYPFYQTIMAFGSFLNGSGYGIIINGFGGVRFSGMLEKHFPLQLLETFWYLLMFWFLVWAENHYRTFSWYKGNRSEALTGFVASSFLVGIGFLRLLSAPLALPSVIWLNFRWDILIAILIIIAGAAVIYKRSAMGTQKKPRDYSRVVAHNDGRLDKIGKWGNDIFN